MDANQANADYQDLSKHQEVSSASRNMKLVDILDHEIGYTVSFLVSDKENIVANGAFSGMRYIINLDSFLHMDTGINEQQSKALTESKLSPDISCIEDFLISGHGESIYRDDRDM